MGNGASAATFGGQDADLQNFNLKNVRDLVYDQEFANGNSGAAATIDWTKGNVQKITLTANCTFTFTAPIGPAKLQLKLTQDGTGSRLVTWPTEGVAAGNLAWVGKAAPTLSTAAASVDFVNIFYDGSVYWGMSALNFG
jgi:hypothetical protein